MKISKYNPNIHEGTQPIRVLSGEIIYWFENADKDFLKTLTNEIQLNALQNSISYLISETKVQEVAYVDETKKITIQETFLSYLWSISYGLVLIFDEVIMRPKIENDYKQTYEDQNKINEAQKLFDYGLSLMSEFSYWDIEKLPNPEYYDMNENSYIEKLNSVFLSAVNFVLVHEFAHVKLGHIDDDKQRSINSVELEKSVSVNDEYNADNYSLQILINGADNIANQSTVRTGILIGLCSLIFFSKSLDGSFHPDPDLRIKNVLESLDLEETDNLWGIATLALQLWIRHYKVEVNIPEVVENYKCLFYFILEELTNYGHRKSNYISI